MEGQVFSHLLFPEGRSANNPYLTKRAGARRPDIALRCSMESRLPQLAWAIDPRSVLCDEQGGNCVRISFDYCARFLHWLVVMKLQPIRRFRACSEKFSNFSCLIDRGRTRPVDTGGVFFPSLCFRKGRATSMERWESAEVQISFVVAPVSVFLIPYSRVHVYACVQGSENGWWSLRCSLESEVEDFSTINVSFSVGIFLKPFQRENARGMVDELSNWSGSIFSY